MSRRSAHDPSGSVSLFPFLAVLICTMGSLILLLVVLMQQARTRDENAGEHAAPSAIAEQATPEATAEAKLEDLNWQITALTTSRETTLKRLQDAQLQLSMTEDQSRQLQSQLDQLEKEAQQLEAVRDRQTDAKAAEQSQLESIKAAIEATKAELAAAREQAAQRGPSYAIIPYKGPAGTDRRPIYIECQEQHVLLQPEGIELIATDFREPIGPGNPLATALRAIREYWLNAGLLDSAAHAYPLLIVRPQGAHTYAACRQALRGWDDEFGYELVPDSMQIQYAAADPSLARVIQQSIREARMRSDLPEPQGLPGTFAEGTADSFAGPPGDNSGGSPLAGPVSEGNQPGGHPEATSRSSEQPAMSAGGGGGDDRGNGPGIDSVNPTARPAESNGPLSLTPPDGAGSSVGSGGLSTGAPSSSLGSVAPLAASQGQNWALPNSAGGAIGMSRPVVVLCEPNRLVLPPAGDQRGAPDEFAFDKTIDSAIPPFVDALWRRIDDWGTAGHGAYWKPTLQVEVDPRAEDVYARFVRLMENSGLQIERRSPE